MGFFKEFFSDLDEPAFLLTWGEKEAPRRQTRIVESDTLRQLAQENRELKRMLVSKKVNSIDTDYRLIE